MTTDRDMERARKLRSRLTGYLASPAHEADAVRIAAALAAERAPLEARIAELAKLLAEARWALRDLLAGLSLDDAPRRAAIDRARETVRRWDAGEPPFTDHCPTCATVARERDDATDAAAGAFAEVERLRAELAEARSKQDAVAIDVMHAAEARGARWGIEAAATLIGQRMNEHERAGLIVSARVEQACAGVVAKLSAADVVRAAREREAEVEGVEEQASEQQQVFDALRGACGQPSESPVERSDLLTRADLDAFRGELAAAIREVSDSRAANAYYNNAVEVLRFVADRLEAER